jgi:ribose transport system substrate-binding protein
MTTQESQPPPTPPASPAPKRPFNFHWPVILTLVVGALLLWHFGVLRPRPSIALVTSGDTPYWDHVIDGATEAARIYDVNLNVIRSKTITTVQNQNIRDLLAERKYDGIAVSPIDPSGQAPVLSEIANVTTLVTFDSDSPVSNRLCFVGTDNYDAGRRCGECVRRALPDGGEVALFIGSLSKENTRNRRQGVIDELLDRPFESEHPFDPVEGTLKGAKYTIIGTFVDSAEPGIATDLAVKATQDFPNVKCFVGLLGYTTPALLQALEQTGKLGKIRVVGFDNNEKTLAGVAAGNVYATILQDQFGCGYHTVRILAETARGNRSGLPLFQQRTLPVVVITKENVAAASAQFKNATGATPTPTTAP